MKAVRVETTEGVRWVNPAQVVMLFPLDGTQTRVITTVGTFEVRVGVNTLLKAFEESEWDLIPAAPAKETRRGK